MLQGLLFVELMDGVYSEKILLFCVTKLFPRATKGMRIIDNLEKVLNHIYLFSENLALISEMETSMNI